MAPKTLLEMAGVPRALPKLAKSALVIIDAQEEYRNGKLPLEGIDKAVIALQGILEATRRNGGHVLHVVHKGRAGALFDLSASGGGIIADVAPLPAEAIIEKVHPNSFHQTTLLGKLQAIQPENIILAGFQTHMCLSSTARAALDLGYLPIIAADASATRALPSADEKTVIPAETIHQSALAALADRFAIIARTHEFS